MTDYDPVLAQLPVLATTHCPFCGVVCPTPDTAEPVAPTWRIRRHPRPTAFALVRGLSRRASGTPLGGDVVVPTPVLSSQSSVSGRTRHHCRPPGRLRPGGTVAPLIAVCTLGVPLLFLLYIIEVDPYEGTFVLSTGLSLVIGAGLGTGWALIASPYVDQALQPAPSASLTSTHALVAAVVVPTLAQLLMCVPIVVVRAIRQRPPGVPRRLRRRGHGCARIHARRHDRAAVALAHRRAVHHQSFLVNLSQAVERGLGLPLISAMGTGLIGASVWVTRGSTTATRGRWITSPAVAFLFAEAVQVGWAFGNLAVLPDPDIILIQLAAIAVLTVLIRVGIHHVLIHEAMETSIGAPRACVPTAATSCQHVLLPPVRCG